MNGANLLSTLSIHMTSPTTSSASTPTGTWHWCSQVLWVQQYVQRLWIGNGTRQTRMKMWQQSSKQQFQMNIEAPGFGMPWIIDLYPFKQFNNCYDMDQDVDITLHGICANLGIPLYNQCQCKPIHCASLCEAMKLSNLVNLCILSSTWILGGRAEIYRP